MTQRVITTHQKASPNAPFAVELFAGVGGFSLGMKAAGIDVALAVEKDEQTLATYSQNFPSTPVLCADVQKLTGLEIRRLLEVAQNQQGREWDGKIDLVFGGPPCQGLSRIGKRDVDDPRNQLIAHFCRLVIELRWRVHSLSLEWMLFCSRFAIFFKVTKAESAIPLSINPAFFS